MNIAVAAWQCTVINFVLSTTAFKPGFFDIQSFVAEIGFHMLDE